ncbi:MAG: FAD-binding oxidoreductase [Thermomicrobiales bacterium]
MTTMRTTRRTLSRVAGLTLAAALTRAIPGQASAAPRGQSAALTGRVFWPSDAEYDAARWDFNTRISRFPAAIVVCSETADVQNAVRWAREQGVPLRARSGGHSYEAFSTLDDGLVIDLAGLQEVTIDPARGEATVGAGVRLGDLYQRLGEQGFALSAGSCPGVGIAGLTLGGGDGFLAREDGLTCDNLLAVELVDARGETLRASESEHPDLFWALRGGGGGNFGIVTRFTFRPRPIGDVVVLSLSWAWEETPTVLAAWQAWAPFTDERLVAELIVPDPSDGAITVVGQFTGTEAELWPLLAPLLASAPVLSQAVETVPFLTAVARFAGPPAAHATFKNTGQLAYAPFSADAIAAFIAQMRAAPSGTHVTGIYPFGGAIGAVDPAATAFVHRQALFSLQYQAYWQDAAETNANLAWAAAMRAAMRPYTEGTYVNFVDSDIADWPLAYYGASLSRLMAVKAHYDPDNVFTGPQSIPLPGS